MFSTELTAAKHLQGCSLVRRDFVVEVSVTYTSGLLKCVANEGARLCHSVYCCRSDIVRPWKAGNYLRNR